MLTIPDILAPAEILHRLRQLADAEGTTIQAMAEAGLSAVLAQHGLPPIEPYAR